MFQSSWEEDSVDLLWTKDIVLARLWDTYFLPSNFGKQTKKQQ